MRRRVRSGWKAVPKNADVIPGDILGAVHKLGIRVYRVDDSGEINCWCPAHLERLGRVDRRPSFSVNARTGLFNCWSCQFSGRFVDLVAYMLHASEDEAVAWIQRQGTIQVVERLFAKTERESERTEEITEASLALFVPPPRWALRRRGLTADACEHYGVLWDPDRQLWIIPVRDENGTLLGWQEKAEDYRYFSNYPKTLKKSRCLFGLETVPKGITRMFLLESPLDPVRMYSLGYTGAVSSFGASVSDRQMQLIKERTDCLVSLMDDDAPGRQARDKLYRKYMGSGLRIAVPDYRRIPDLEGKDVGDMTARQIRVMVDTVVPATLLPWLRARE